MNQRNKTIIMLVIVVVCLTAMAILVFGLTKSKSRQVVDSNNNVISPKVEEAPVLRNLEPNDNFEQKFVKGKIKAVSAEAYSITLDVNGKDEVFRLSTSTVIKAEVFQASDEYNKQFKIYSDNMAVAYKKMKNGEQLTEEENKGLIPPVQEYTTFNAAFSALAVGKNVSLLQIKDKRDASGAKDEVMSVTMLGASPIPSLVNSFK